MRGTPESWGKLPPMKDPINTIASDLDASVHRAVRAGIERLRIVVDPGLGFGKRRDQNSEILARLPVLGRLEAPILVGPSRKAFLGQFQKPDESPDLDFMTAAAVTAAILGGAHIVRVHDVAALKPVVQLADQILSFTAVEEPAQTPRPRARSSSSRERPDIETPPMYRPPLRGSK
jgi:dihydropteroate synthase